MAASLLDALDEPVVEARARRLRGGWRMQERAAEEREVQGRPRKRCKSSRLLIGDWCAGRTSSAQVWRHADANLDDGFEHPSLARLHRAAAGGLVHAHAGLIKLFESNCGLSQYVSQLHSAGSIKCWLKPSTLFKLLHQHNRAKWETVFGADADGVEQFWTNLFASEQGRELKALHPDLRDKEPGQLRHCLPRTVHEDAAPYSKKCSCTNVS